MINFISDILKDVFDEEIADLITGLKGIKKLVFIAIIIGILVWAYIRWPQTFDLVFTLTGNLLEWLLLFWVFVLTIYVFSREKSKRWFRDSFRHGLRRWEYYGEWRTEQEGNRNVLIVTNSDIGGIARPCRLWTDYVFEFETKIIKHNSTWIIRAKDTFNYVMFQCQPTQIVPHFRVNGHWIRLDPIPLQEPLPINTWFGVHIKVKGTRVVVIVKVNGVDKEIYNDALLEPQVVDISLGKEPPQIHKMIISYTMGSIGFRESGKMECAHFREVCVRKNQN